MGYTAKYCACIGALMLACAAPAARAAPVITSVTTTGVAGQSFGLIITGSGFGTGPQNVAYPYYGDTNFFLYRNMHPSPDRPRIRPMSYVDWTAGYQNAKVTDPVTLDYMVWTDTEIQFCGFYGAYGQNGWINTSGDKFEIRVTVPGGSRAIYYGTVP